MKRKAYPTDLTDAQWSLIQPVLPAQPKRGRPAQDLREVVNGILYICKSGLDWRMMPHDLPSWQTVYAYYQRWSKIGIWERIDLHLSAHLQDRLNKQNPPLVMHWISNRLKQVEKLEGVQVD
jgi:transposase